MYAKPIYKTLRKLKRNSVVVADIMKTLMNLPSVDAVSIKQKWNNQSKLKKNYISALIISNVCNSDRVVELY